MIHRLVLSGCLVWCLVFAGLAQKSAYSISLFNHATSLPGGSWAGAWHPGFDLGLQRKSLRHFSTGSSGTIIIA
ncbi:MAG: hypothetical protein IPL46_10650 [Saprospiraceae bacterium]|nr:hypothetical protein [Saprospiraceae bacterium]